VSLRHLPRPVPRATPLQRPCWHLGEAVRAARSDRRTLEAFVSIASEAIAAEAVRLLGKARRS